jgi:hypothetical protein
VSATARIAAVAAINDILAGLEPADAAQVVEFFSDTHSLDARIGQIEASLSDDGDGKTPTRYLSDPP